MSSNHARSACSSQPRLSAFICCCIILLLAAPAAAQRGSAIISGVVKSAEGKAVAGALVQVQEQSGGVLRATRTDEHGKFRVGRLPRGFYEVRVSSGGFAPVTRRDNQLRDGQSISLAIHLSPAAKPQ